MKQMLKRPCKPLAATLAVALQLAAIAAVPTEWQVRVGPKATVYQAERYHGDALALRATLSSGGLPLDYQGAARLYAQTNGMGAVWWNLADVTVSGNVLSATWLPEFDTGADVVDVFLGAPSNYQAHARIRFLPSPGPVPNALPLPTPVLDFAAVEIQNLAALTNGWTFGGDYDALSNRPQINGVTLGGTNNTAQGLGLLGTSGGTMTGGLTVLNLTVGSRESGSTVGLNSVAEGFGVTASAAASHAEGIYTVASGAESHAEGSYNLAIGTSSHAEGTSNEAKGSSSHAEGEATMARNECEHAQGRFNASHTGVAEADNTLSSIGFGIDNDHRKNAVETMKDGKTYIYGLGGYVGTNPGAAQDLAQSVNGKAAAADLRYALVTPKITTQFGFPASMFPLVFTNDGTTYTISSADDLVVRALEETPVDILNAVVGESSGEQETMALCPVNSETGETGAPFVESLLFNGETSTTLTVTRTATLADRAANAVTGAATLTLPAAVLGRLRDLIVDLDNSAGASDLGLELASDATAYLDVGGAHYLVAFADGDDLADLLTVAAGKRARLYFTETAQTATPTGGTSPVLPVPVISLQRLTITVGGAL